MSTIVLDIWLYGALARYGGAGAQSGYAHLELRLPQGSTISDLLAHLGMPTAERGITFINGQLSAMPGLQPDLDHVLQDNDRVAFFDHRSMWPFQYRHGAALTPELASAMSARDMVGLHHTFDVQGQETPKAE